MPSREEHVQGLLSMAGPYRAASRLDDGPGVSPKWPVCTSPDRHYHLRVVLNNESVLDIGDHTPWPESARHTNALHDSLAHFGIAHQVALSGGKGIHIHVFHVGPPSWLEPGEEDWRWRICMVVLEMARILSGIDDLTCDYRLLSPHPQSRLVREYGAKKAAGAPESKVMWCDWPIQPWLPLPNDRDMAYRMARAGFPTIANPQDTSRLDLLWTSAVGAPSCPKRPACLVDFLSCPDCPIGA